jgi:Subtilase family
MKHVARAATLLVLLLGAANTTSHLRASPAPQNPPPQPGDISPEAYAQISALLAEKAARSSIDQKIDSQLLYGAKMSAGVAIAPGVDEVAVDLPYADDGHVVVDVKARLTTTLREGLFALGAEILSESPEQSSLRIHVDLDRVRAVGALPDVIFMQPRQDATTSRSFPRDRPARFGVADRTARSLGDAPAAYQEANVFSSPTGQGSRSSQGDVTHRAHIARASGKIGQGVKIGVLSDGVTSLITSQSMGDLGPVTVLAGQAGSGDEGTGMLELIHDVAPGAQLFFATGFSGIASFANNIRGLRAGGCDIIVDDVFYFAESPFQDGQAPGVISPTNGGVIAQAVNDVTADGALYFTSAGNSGNKNDNTSGTWEGDFVDGGNATGPLTGAGRVHFFPGNVAFDTVTSPGQSQYDLYWSDPLGASSNDYDLFLLNAAGTTLLAASTNNQTGTQDPFEAIGIPAGANLRLVIVKFSGAARFLRLVTNRGRLSISTPGATTGHGTTVNAFGVAATPAASNFGAPPNPAGPYPNPFTAINTVELFSSDGPRKLFFNPNGSLIGAPGNLLASGGITRQKPDITAADGATITGVGNFPTPFFGTSAAAPHAAAIAALVKSAAPGLTPAQVRAALVGSAIDIEAAGVDQDSGAGIIMADTALANAGVPTTAALVIDGLQAIDNPGNANGAPEAGEGVKLTIPLANLGVNAATAIAAALTTTSAGITITQPANATYPDLAALATAPSASPYFFTVASDFPCPRLATFTLTVTYSGGPSPRVFTFDVPIGPPPYQISPTLDGLAPPASAGVATATGTQSSRLNRDSVVSACGVQKATPTLAAGAPLSRQFESFTFNTCAISGPNCVFVEMQGASAVNFFTAAYQPTFNPGNIQTNYRADPGTSAPVRNFSFDLAAGPQSFAIDVHNVNGGIPPAGQQAYTLLVSGACLGACNPPNQVPVAKAKAVTVFASAVACNAPASVDDGSFDADGDPLTITQSPAGPYAIGTTAVLLTVTDSKGATSQATGSVTVVDNQPPAIANLTASPSILWPPNHVMVDITVPYDLTDNCGTSSCLLSISSNEPVNGVGDGNTSVDWTVVDAHHVRLRAERNGSGNGRIYTIKVTCTDPQDNVTVMKTSVTVPQHQ